MTWLRILDQAPVRALTGGILYALLVLSVDRFARLVERSVHVTARGWGLAHEHLWAAIAQIAGAASAIGFIFALLLEGSFAPNDVGLAPIDWTAHGPWLAVLVPGTIALIVFFWGPYFSSVPYSIETRGPELMGSRVLPEDDGSPSLLHALTDEASLIVFRAASIPLLGPYWGIWFGLAWGLGVRILCRRHRLAPMSPARHGFYYLAIATDWLSATLFVVTGSLWACLLGRIACHTAAQILHRWGMAHRFRSRAAHERTAPGEEAYLTEATLLPSGEDKSQNN